MSPTPAHEVSGAISALIQGRHQQPHDLLGQHLEAEGLRVRVLRPMASSVRVRFEDGMRELSGWMRTQTAHDRVEAAARELAQKGLAR